MILENSPNVTYVNNSQISEFLSSNEGMLERVSNEAGISTQVYADKGIYVIDVEIDNVAAIENAFVEYEKAGHLYPVTKSGLKYNDQCSDVGSYRFCTNSQKLADFLDAIISSSNAFPLVHNSEKEETSTYAGVSPYFRFMRYSKGGLHFPHYDSDYQFANPYSSNYTAYSLVMYFTDCETGNIAFINDKTVHCQDRSDWDRQANEDEIYLKVAPKKGRIVLFRHDLCHSVLELTGDDTDRMMVRGDLVFQRTLVPKRTWR